MKKLAAILLTLAMTASFASGCSAQEAKQQSEATEIILTINQPTMLVNEISRPIDAEGTTPLILENRTLLPVRALVEAMGGTVACDIDTQTVTLSRNNETLRLIIDSTTAYVNDNPVELDITPIVINDRTMLPARFIAENFHFTVEWDAENQRVIIQEEMPETAKPSMPQYPSSAKPTEKPALVSETPVQNENQITVTVNRQNFTATLEDNGTAKAFYSMLPLTLDMDEINGNEKYYFLDEGLPGNNRRIEQIQTGDMMLYGSNCIVVFFKTFSTSYSYTPIGHIDDAEGYAAALPTGSATITFSK